MFTEYNKTIKKYIYVYVLVYIKILGFIKQGNEKVMYF